MPPLTPNAIFMRVYYEPMRGKAEGFVGGGVFTTEARRHRDNSGLRESGKQVGGAPLQRCIRARKDRGVSHCENEVLPPALKRMPYFAILYVRLKAYSTRAEVANPS